MVKILITTIQVNLVPLLLFFLHLYRVICFWLNSLQVICLQLNSLHGGFFVAELSTSLKLYKNHFNTAIRGHSFSQRIVNDWNTLPHEIVSAPNVLIFKTKLDVFLFDHRFDFI